MDQTKPDTCSPNTSRAPAHALPKTVVITDTPLTENDWRWVAGVIVVGLLSLAAGLYGVGKLARWWA